MKQQYNSDRVWTCRIKKRHRKDLSIEEIEEIVDAAKEPFRYHKDIAQKFRVPAQLVSTLVRESQKKPENLEARRDREHLDERKRQAIEEVVTARL